MGAHNAQLQRFQRAVKGLGTVNNLLDPPIGALCHRAFQPFFTPFLVAAVKLL